MPDIIQIVIEFFGVLAEGKTGWRFWVSILAGVVLIAGLLWLLPGQRLGYLLAAASALTALVVGLWWDVRKGRQLKAENLRFPVLFVRFSLLPSAARL